MEVRSYEVRTRCNRRALAAAIFIVISSTGPSSLAFQCTGSQTRVRNQRLDLQLSKQAPEVQRSDGIPLYQQAAKTLSSVAACLALSATLLLGTTGSPAFAENELSAKYGGKGFDSSLVDQTCLVDKCSLQAKACLADDPSCRKGLTCTAKCMGDNTCITGCMAQYGDKNLDNLLKCTIEDNNCIKIAILDGGSDKFGEEPRSPAPTIRNFNVNSMEGQWYKVVGFNPNYDCYACQRNTFTNPDGGGLFGVNFPGSGTDKLQLDVEFSMMKMLPDGTPPPPTNTRESVKVNEEDGLLYGSRAIGFNDYKTQEVMVFDTPQDAASQFSNVVLGKGNTEASYQRTAHSEGEMFGLKFWENWYVIGENDPGTPEFKFVYYNGKTRQNTYDGAFVYSRTKELGPGAMKKVHQIASDANMNPDQFCKIRNGCFKEEASEPLGAQSNPFRGIIASTKLSELLGVEPVAAESKFEDIVRTAPQRHWWQEAGDYFEDPHQHFRAMDSLRQTMDWKQNNAK